MMIVENRIKVFLFEEQGIVSEERQAILASAGLDSSEYLQTLIENVRAMSEVSKDAHD